MADNRSEDGGFHLVPGFHKVFSEWTEKSRNRLGKEYSGKMVRKYDLGTSPKFVVQLIIVFLKLLLIDVYKCSVSDDYLWSENQNRWILHTLLP